MSEEVGLDTIEGDIFEVQNLYEDELGYRTYLAHQCNATTKGARGIAKEIFSKWPHANVYKEARQTGTCIVRYPIANLIAQQTPGKPRTKNSADTTEQRLKWFEESLKDLTTQIAASQRVHTQQAHCVLLPFRIGCGLAGGDWDQYRNKIEQIAQDSPSIKFILVKKF
jgi:hypothetical protein